MAEIVGGLFGVTPESLQMQREKQAQQEALAYAQLQDPFARANYQIYQGAAGLGRQLSGLLGAQDPEMAKAAALQGILKQADTASPEGWNTLARTLAQQGFSREAAQASQQGLGMQEKYSVISKNMRERPAGLDEKVFAALATKATPASVKAAQDAGNDISLLQVPENVKVSTYGQILKDAGFTEGTPEFQKRMQDFAAAELESTRKGKGITNILPGQPVPDKDWLKFREFSDKTPIMQKTSALISELPNALETIRMSTSNDIAAAALPKALASVAGEGKVTSNADIARYARTGGLDERLIQGATSFLTGRATQTKKEEAEKYASAVYRGALMERKKFLQSEAKQLGYDKSPNYDQAISDIDAELAKFKKPSENKRVDSVVRVQPTGNPLIDKYLNQ